MLALLLASGLLLQTDEVTKKLIERYAADLAEAKDTGRINALQELARFGADAKPALPAIAKVLKEGTPEVRREAARTLGRLATHAPSGRSTGIRRS